MQITYSFDKEFDVVWEGLKVKYPNKLFDIDGVGKQLDSCQFAKDFFSSKTTADASIDPNANVEDMSVIVYNTESDKPAKRLNSYYILWKEMRRLYGSQVAQEVLEMQLIGDIYIHDAHGISSGMPYCFNYSCYDIMTMGLNMVNKLDCLPPKYFTAFKSQVEQFTVIASNSTLGATGLADLLVCMSYYVKNMLTTLMDEHFHFASAEDVWAYVKANLVSMVYTFNQPMRANQSPFTNVSIYDLFFLLKLQEDYIFPDGSTIDIDIVMKLQELFLDIMNEEMRRTPITFPVTTACFALVSKDDVENNRNTESELGDIKDLKFLDMISEKNLEYGFINIYCGDSATLSSCCRLRSDRKNEYFNSFGSGSSKIGSLGVCSINFPRLAYKYVKQGKVPNHITFLESLKKMIGVSARVNHAKRNIIKKRIENGNEPLYSLGYMDINKQYSTTGVNGLNECLEILGYDILSQEGQDLALQIIDTINRENDKYQKQYQAPHNCEQVPGETMSIKMATKDKIMGFNRGDYDFYSNQFIPLITKADMLDRIKIQGILDKHFSGGAICHLNVETRLEDKEQMKLLIITSAKKGVVYFAINYNLQRCEHGHMTVGKGHVCSICGAKIVDNYTRVVGFVTNTKNWHIIRRQLDYDYRQFYEGIELNVQQ